MEQIIQILTSPVLWSTVVAFLAITAGIRQYIAKIKSDDEAIKESRRQRQSTEDQSAD